jgi:hypothetical protein
MHTYINTYIYTYMRKYRHTYMHTYIHIYIQSYIIQTYINKYIHTYIHTYIHIQTHVLVAYASVELVFIIVTNVCDLIYILYICLGYLRAFNSKTVPYRPRKALRAPGGRGSQVFRQSAHEGGKVVSPTNRSPLTPPPQERFLVLVSVRG